MKRYLPGSKEIITRESIPEKSLEFLLEIQENGGGVIFYGDQMKFYNESRVSLGEIHVRSHVKYFLQQELVCIPQDTWREAVQLTQFGAEVAHSEKNYSLSINELMVEIITGLEKSQEQARDLLLFSCEENNLEVKNLTFGFEKGDDGYGIQCSCRAVFVDQDQRESEELFEIIEKIWGIPTELLAANQSLTMGEGEDWILYLPGPYYEG